MRAIQILKPGVPLQLVEREIPEPQMGEVRIKVEACGVCHSDSFVVEGAFPGIQYPRIPGHEVAGVIDKIGKEVTTWRVGDRVGVGWNGGYCTTCEPCRRGFFTSCQNLKICGMSYDGGYAEYMVAPVEALARIPDELSAVEAAPMLCAGVTTFNALRNSGATPPDRVAILGIGGLGHLAIQYAAKMGFHTIAIARGKEKEGLAKKLGAKHYIDSTTQDPAEELLKLGQAKVILATAVDAKAINAVMNGLGVNGKLIVVGAPHENISVLPRFLINLRRAIAGWASGASIDSQDTMDFSALTGVRSMNEVFPLERAPEAYARMMEGKPRFRAVLKIS